MKKLSLVGICLLGILIAGCGEKAEPPLTTDALDPNAVTTENPGQAAGSVPSRPQPNPNAKYAPTR
jgi:hypothetical protein